MLREISTLVIGNRVAGSHNLPSRMTLHCISCKFATKMIDGRQVCDLISNRVRVLLGALN